MPKLDGDCPKRTVRIISGKIDNVPQNDVRHPIDVSGQFKLDYSRPFTVWGIDEQELKKPFRVGRSKKIKI